MLFTPERMGKYRPHYKKTLAVIRGVLQRGDVKNTSVDKDGNLYVIHEGRSERERGALLALIKREEESNGHKS